MSSRWPLRLILAVVAVVVVLSIVIATRSRQTDSIEPVGGERASASPIAAARAAGKPAWREAPRIDGDQRVVAADAGAEPYPGVDLERAEPAASTTPRHLSAAKAVAGGAGSGDTTVPSEELHDGKKPGEREDPALKEAATASGVVPRFAAFRQADGSDAKGPPPVEEENVDFTLPAGAYFPMNSLLGYPNRGGLEVEQGTVMFWVQPIDWDGTHGGVAYSFFLLRDPTSLNHTFTILSDRGQLRYQIVNQDGVEVDIFVPIEDWQKGEWHHVAGTWGDGLMDLYLDGQLVGEKAVDGLPAVPPNALAYWGSNRGDNGAGAILADGRIFDSVLSGADIAAVAQLVPR